MELRVLKEKDCGLMLEWMHDPDVIKDMNTNFLDKKLADCTFFVQNSMTVRNKHFAIVDANDEYMGTVSLKNIDINNGSAEFAITIRKTAMGKGYSSYAMRKIIDIAFSEYDLKVVYWYVNKKNIRAIKFYGKMGYWSVPVEKIERLGVKIESVEADAMEWYCICKDETVS